MAMLHNLSIGELADRLAASQISSVELTRHFLARIERFNPGLNALITLTAEQALASAQAAWESSQARFQDILEAHRALVSDRLAMAQAIADQRREMAELTLLTGAEDLPSAFAPNPVAGRH